MEEGRLSVVAENMSKLPPVVTSRDAVINTVTSVELKMAAVDELLLHMSVLVGSQALCGLNRKLPTTTHTLTAIATTLPTTAPCRIGERLLYRICH